MARTATSRAGEGRRGTGFTMLELLIVMAILGLTAALAVPMFAQAMPDIQAKAAARDVAAMMRAARSLAITGNREVAVAVDLDRRTVELAGSRSEAIGKGIVLGLYTAEEELIGPGAGRIRFYPDGTSTGGSVRLSTATRTYDVRVDWISGGVTIDD
jgi:general secretion pathway protein H